MATTQELFNVVVDYLHNEISGGEPSAATVSAALKLLSDFPPALNAAFDRERQQRYESLPFITSKKGKMNAVTPQ